MVFGFVMLVISAIDYLTGNNQITYAVGVIGIALVLIGMFLSRKKCEVK